MNKCVFEHEILRISSEVHPLAVLVIMPPKGVIPSVDVLVAGEAYRSPARIHDMSFALPVPAEVFPTGITGPLSFDDLEERAGLVAARLVWGKFRLLTFRDTRLGRWW